MPWQQHVVDVIMEIDPITGELAYQEFGLTVPRQSGKSTLLLAKAVHRASAQGFFGPRQKIVYTAQTRQKAREKWEEDYAAELVASRSFMPRVNVHKGNGNEHIRFLNGSRFGIEANTEKAGHGSTLDEAYIDEAFAQVDNRLEQAFRPAMITRRNKQLGWVSTAGWSDGSPYLQAKVRKGRQQAEMGLREGLAYFEWSAPQDADPEDRDVWRECMPALGRTIKERAIADELRDLELPDFRRAYLNQWVPKASGEWTVIGQAAWQVLADTRSQISGPVVFAADATDDQSFGSIGVAGYREDGFLHGEVVEGHRSGTAWMVDRALELHKAWSPQLWVVDPKRQAHSLIPALEAVGADVVKTSWRDMAQACAGFFEVVTDSGTFRHIGQPDLDLAVAQARKRDLVGAWAWDARTGADVSPLVAVTLAVWGVRTHLVASEPSVYVF
jgi:phage terminase large subunit-like protein